MRLAYLHDPHAFVRQAKITNTESFDHQLSAREYFQRRHSSKFPNFRSSSLSILLEKENHQF